MAVRQARDTSVFRLYQTKEFRLVSRVWCITFFHKLKQYDEGVR